MSISLRDLVNNSLRVSSLPEIYFQINEVLNDPHSSFADIADVISADTSLSARLLKIVNSPFYGFPSEIDAISHAVSIVGTRQLRDLALATTVISCFKGVPQDHVNMNSFWRHSITCGIAARAIAIYNRQVNPERFFLAGILHDIGRLVLFENLPDAAEKIMEQFKGGDKPLYRVEREILGFDHTEIGAALLEKWGLPESLREIIAFHHDPFKSTRYGYEASIIHMGDIFSKSMEAGSSGDPYIPPLQPESWDQLKMETSVLPFLWNQVETQYENTVDAVLTY